VSTLPIERLASCNLPKTSQGVRAHGNEWASLDKAVALDVALKAIEAYGKTDVGLPEGPPFFRFSDSAECERVLLDAGFAEPKVQEVNQTGAIRTPVTSCTNTRIAPRSAGR
jgi:hypothetical protein